MTAWEKVLRARAPQRPSSKWLLDQLCDDFFELHGDRLYGDDGAICGGLARIQELEVTVIAVVKGKDPEENKQRNFGMVHPEGYRKALRLMKQAEKFNRPVVTLIDTPGAYPGIDAEKRGQGSAIAQNLMTMINLKVPTLTIILGEAGSGGALALALSDRVWMFENAIYAILSPEGFASILYKDPSKVKEVAEVMKLTAQDLLDLGVIDRIISEQRGIEQAAFTLKNQVYLELKALINQKPNKRLQERFKRYRNQGEVSNEHANS